MELAVCRDELRAIPQRQRREKSRDELMRVLAERDVAVGIAKQTPESSLYQRRLSAEAARRRGTANSAVRGPFQTSDFRFQIDSWIFIHDSGTQRNGF
jgi:hypothetical protein